MTSSYTVYTRRKVTTTIAADVSATKRISKNLPARRYRPELHGVRGLAILGVVLFHLFGNGRVSGGIDIFLTISGFLFTAMLLRDVTERHVAILGVVLCYLFGNGRVSCGIDIFLTISGFLFTAMLLREVTERDGVINFARYFGRLFRRIFVPAAIVIVATVAIGMVIFPFPQ